MSEKSGYETHEVVNQPPPLADHNVFESDRCLGRLVGA
jgi:hypothetical protein